MFLCTQWRSTQFSDTWQLSACYCAYSEDRHNLLTDGSLSVCFCAYSEDRHNLLTDNSCQHVTVHTVKIDAIYWQTVACQYVSEHTVKIDTIYWQTVACQYVSVHTVKIDTIYWQMTAVSMLLCTQWRSTQILLPLNNVVLIFDFHG